MRKDRVANAQKYTHDVIVYKHRRIMTHTQQKFILTHNGTLRLGCVKRHCELLPAGERCIGGGYYELDFMNRRLLLSGASSQYGEPQWEKVEKITLSAYYKGLKIIYSSWDNWKTPVYIDDISEIIYG